MVPGSLPRPLLSLIFEPVANIQYSDEDALSSLWSVFTKVGDAISHGRRLENMTWRLWHRAYSRRVVIHPTTAGNDCDLRIASALPLSPSLSFSSSSEVTSSSDWDHDLAVNEETSLNRDSGDKDAQCSSLTTPCLEDGMLAPSQTATSSASPASSLLSQDSSLNRSKNMWEVPARVASTLYSADQGLLSNISQDLRFPSSVPRPEPIDPIRNTTRRDHSTPIESLPPPPFQSQKRWDNFRNGSIPVSATSNSIVLASAQRPLTVGKIISQMLAEKFTQTKPTRQLMIDTIVALHPNDSFLPPKVEIVAPTGSPTASLNSTLTSASSTPRQSLPTVIVVNPTPHPTPPATPSINTSEKSFDLSSGLTTAIQPPRLALGPDVTGSSLSPLNNNNQLATPVSIGKPSVSINHVTCEMPRMDKQLRSIAVPNFNTTTFATSFSNSLPKKVLGASNSIVLPERPVSGGEIASHLPTPAAELTPDMCTSRASTAPIEAPTSVTFEDKKFFLAVPHSGSGGSGHDSTESPDSLETGSINARRRETARGSPLIDLRASHTHSKSSSRREEELSSSFSASSPAGRPRSMNSSKGDSVASRTKPRATFMVSSGAGRRKVSSKRGVKNLYKKENERWSPLVESGSVDEGDSKETDAIRREPDTLALPQPPTPPKTDMVAVQVPRVKTMHQHLSRLNQNTQHQTSLRQLPTNPPRRPASPSLSRSNVTNGVRPDVVQGHKQSLQTHVQLVGQLGLGILPRPAKRSHHSNEAADTSDEYSTTDTDEEDDWESDSGSTEEKREKQQHIKSRKSDSLQSERIRYHNHNNGNRQRDPGESVRDAALEAQRQRDMFQKLPPRTYSNLGQLPRTKSGLSLLFRPDPELFPIDHPYRTTRSSQDLLARNWSALAPPLAMTAIQQRSTPIAPVEANVTVSSIKVNELHESSVDLTRRSSATQVQRSGGNYRPRAKPVDQEEESDSDENDIPILNSVAERRLADLAKQGTRLRAGSPTTRLKQQQQASPNAQKTSQIQADTCQPLPRTTTMPILPHQFLPEPAPLQMPHEIRRRIISEELDEELRRNLLWERSQNQMPGRPARRNGSILPGPWRTLTPVKPAGPEAPPLPSTESQSQTRLFATQRTKSWAGEYHATGW